MKIVEIRESTRPIKSNIRNAYIDFSKMTLSLVAVVTDVIRDGKPVIGYGFNSNGRYGQGALMRERFIPRVLEAAPDSLLDERDVICPHKVWAAMMNNEKPGGHGERSVAVGTIDMAVWDAVAKIEGLPLFQMLANRYGNGQANRKVFVYAAGGYYWPGQGLEGLTREQATRALCSCETSVARAIPTFTLTEEQTLWARQGKRFAWPSTAGEGPHGWLDASGSLVAVGESREGLACVIRGFCPTTPQVD